jgi:ubiquinol-cytochrome c reductase cytochrome c1 subunit
MNAQIKSLAATLALVLFAGTASAAEEGETPHYPLKKPIHHEWTFSGPLGHFDKEQLQRGFQVYREVCASCHSLDLVSFRNLAEDGGPGFSEDVVRALAAEYQITDGPNDEGDMFERPGIPSDRFPAPFANEEAAKASNNGAAPPDFSLIAKARAPERGFPWFVFDIFTLYQESGPDYIVSLLTGYTSDEPNEGGTYDNPYFVGGPSLAMAPPLSDELVDYAQNDDDDPTNDVPETTLQYAKDVSAFLMWAAEPHMEQRKAMGFSVMLFLIVFAGLIYFTKKKVWSDVEH